MNGNGDRPAGSAATRRTALLALAGVSAIGAVVSYFHALAVVRATGAGAPVAYLVPFLADLVILGASAAVLDARRSGHPRPGLATLALGVGIAVTLAMNVAAGWPNGLAAALVAGWPAVAFVLSLETLAVILRRGRGVALIPHEPPDAPATYGHPEPPTLNEALTLLLDSTSRRGLARELDVPRYRVEAWAARVAGPAPEDAPAGVPLAAGTAPAPAGAHHQPAAMNGHGGGG